jgi:ferrous iron transport protein B
MSSTCCTPPPFVPPAVPPPGGALKTVVLIGPPNSGKSTLFNRLTGLRQKVANFPGVTVEQRLGLMAGVGREDLTLIDLPGIYSLTPYSEDARVAIDVLRGKMPGTPKPDAVLLVMDALHMTRQLMLAAPVLAVGLPTLVLLNMSDLMESRGGHIDTLKLARELGAPVAQISAVHGTGLDAVPLFLNQQTERKAAKPLALPVLGNAASTHSWAAQVSRRTGYQAPLSVESTHKIDNVLLHRFWGPLLFLIVVVGVFEVVFSIGQPMSDGFGDILARMGELVRPLLPAGWLQSLLLDGAWKGISSVLVFLPQILLLFLFIGILEDSGYLARAALIADRVMRTIGLNGKAFIPLLSAYACAVPAIMATRTIENKRDRFATILVTPFMTCSARLPVYMLLIAAFIPNYFYLHGVLGLRTIVMLSLYLAGLAAEELDSEVERDSVHS